MEAAYLNKKLIKGLATISKIECISCEDLDLITTLKISLKSIGKLLQVKVRYWKSFY